MNEFPATLLMVALWAYLAGVAGALLFQRVEKLSNGLGFGFAAVGGLCGMVACTAALATDAAGASRSLELFPSLIPSVRFSIHADALGCFFGLIVSLLGVALSIYSLGCGRGYFGRKNVGLLGAGFNLLLLSTTLVFLADHAVFFLIAWEIMALTAYGLVSFEHEQEETRQAGVFFFVMSHLGTGCLILGFLLLFQAAGSYDFASFHALGNRMPASQRNGAFLLFLLGFGVKAGMVPLHIWLPAAHPVAPSNVSALRSGVLIKTGIYGMTRVFFDFLGTPPNWWGGSVLTLGTISAVLGVLFAPLVGQGLLTAACVFLGLFPLDLVKFLGKDMVISEHASWIFSCAPSVVFLTALLTGLMVPMVHTPTPLGLFGGVLAVVGLLALGRFFLALGGLDPASAFGGMGSSREMTLSAIAEPTLMPGIFTVAIGAGSTDLSQIARHTQSATGQLLNPAHVLAFVAMFVVLLAAIAALVVYAHEASHVYVVAALTLVGKVIFLPWLLNRMVQRIQIHQEIEPLLDAPTSTLICGGLTLLGYVVARPFTSLERLGNTTLAVALTLLLTGFFRMINRRKALTQVLALLTVENGVMLAAVALTSYGMPLVVELGIVFDVLVAVMVLGILVYRIRENFASMDTSKLNQLRG